MFFDKRIIKLDVDARDSTEIITKMAKALKERDVIKDSYLEHVLKRETDFPTGLELEEGFGVAIPHTDSAYVNTSQIALATLKNPVLFKSMVNKSVNVKVNIVFMIAMSKPHEQAQLLSNLMNFCQNKTAIKALMSASDIDQADQILKKYGLN